MTTHILRITVRGEFDDLTAARREALTDEIEEHDLSRSSFTREGFFVYDSALHAFNLRYELRLDDESVSDIEAEAALLAKMISADRLTKTGIGYKRLRASAMDMASIWT